MLRFVPLLILISSLQASSAHAIFVGKSVAPIVKKVKHGVVNIQTTKMIQNYSYYGNEMDMFFQHFMGLTPEMEKKQNSLGSGFVYDKEGRIVTNNHVIEDADEIILQFEDQKKSYTAKLIGRDKRSDLALLKIISKETFSNLALGNSDKIEVGDIAIAVGNPFGLSNTVTAGIISAKHRAIGQGPYDNFLQTDASINPGNSGGPLLNENGEVIGINTAIRAQANAIGFAIPINLAKEIIGQLLKNGRVIRTWLGIAAENINIAYRKRYKIQYKEGVMVSRVVLNQPADTNNITPGDVILEIEGKKIENITDCQKVLLDKKKGDKIKIVILRKGKNLTKSIPLSIIPDDENLPVGYDFI